MRLALCLALPVLVSSAAFAQTATSRKSGFAINPALHAAGSFSKAAGEEEEVSDTTLIYNVTMGWVFDFGLHAGAKYYKDRRITDTSVEESTTETVTVSRTTTTSGFGPTVGYYALNGFVLNGSILFIKPEKKAPDARLYGGYAEVYDAAYRVQLGDYAIGPQVTLAKFRFKKVQSGGETESLSGPWQEQSYLPFVGLWMFF